MAIMTMKYAPHEIAKIFPEMTPDEKRELTLDVKKHGLQEPIIIFEGQVLDGRSRQEACAKAGQKARYVEFEHLHPDIKNHGALAFAVGRNIKRRHLTSSQRAILAARTIPAFEKEAKARQLAALKKGAEKPARQQRLDGEAGRSAAKAARAAGVSETQVKKARKILREQPEKAEAIKAGRLTLGKALPRPAPKRLTLGSSLGELTKLMKKGETSATADVGQWRFTVRKAK